MHVRRCLAAAVVAVSVLALGEASEAGTMPSVRGSGMVTLSEAFGDFAGDPVRFQLQAQGRDGATAGTFNVVHLDDSGGLYAHIVGDVTCVLVADGVAYTTGIVRKCSGG